MDTYQSLLIFKCKRRVSVTAAPWWQDHIDAIRFITVLACGSVMISAGRACAQATNSGEPRTLQGVAAEEDWGFLADPSRRTEPLDDLKYISLGSDGAYASIGGEVRAFYEGFSNEDFGALPVNSSYGESRVLLHGEIVQDDNWRIFGELQSSTIGDRPGGPRPTIDKDVLDLLEGFVEWRSTDQDATLSAPTVTARVGRQELDFGSGRVFSSRASSDGQGPNVLQGMDVGRLIWRTGPWRLDLFGGRPVQNNPGIFDDRSAAGQAAWGAYLTLVGVDGTPTSGLDGYYFGTERPGALFYTGVGYEHRHTVGARAFKTGGPYDYDVETYYQFGAVESRTINAGGMALQAGRSFTSVWWKPRVGALAGANSGGGGANEVRTFFPPFPRGVYFGNLRAIGPENTAAAEISLDLHPTDTVTLSAGTFAFWRTSLNDGVYALSGQEVAPPVGSRRFVGWQPVVSATWHVDPHLSLNAAYETLRLGPFLETTPGLKPIDYTAVWAQYLF